MHEEIVDLIERSGVAFGKFGTGVSQTAIDNAEKSLGILLPASCKWWLRNYGGGQIGGDLVYGLDEQEIGMPDVVSLAQLNARNGFHGIERLEFYVGNEESFYFDTTKMADSGECDVYWYDADANDSYFYAAGFAEFLKKRIKEIYRL